MTNIIHKTNYRALSKTSDISDEIKSLTLHRVRNPTTSFFANSGRYGNKNFIRHEYDLYEYGRIIDTEALVSRAFQKKKTLVFKQGYEITSKNAENLAYVKRRLDEIAYVSRIPFRKLLRETAKNIITFHNAYIVKVRKKSASSGKMRLYRGVKEVEPIAAWFNLAPETIETKINESGEGKKFRQHITGNKYRDFPEHNIIHDAYDKRTGYTMGTPPLEAVKDDILALRRIEESVETLIYKSLFPIIHVKVGTDKNPARTMPNGVSEVSAATQLLANIEDNGGLVTSERVEVNAIGSESLALRVESYLDHFKKRVYAGLGMSGIDFGDGDTTGRATGEVLSASLADSVIDYQVEMEDLITREMFDELLLETGKYAHPFEISAEDRVFLTLRNTSTDEMIKKESHALNMMNSGLTLHNEAREFIGKEPLTEEQMRETSGYRSQKYMDELEVNRQNQINEFQAEQQIKIVKATPRPAGASGGSSSTPKKSSSSSSTTKKTKSGNTKTKNTKAQGAKKSAASITSPKNKKTRDYISTSLIRSIQNGESLDRISIKAMRLFSDYSVGRMTSGIMDSSEYMDENLEREVMNAVTRMCDDLSSKSLNTIKITTIVDKTIDILNVYVNNVLIGSK